MLSDYFQIYRSIDDINICVQSHGSVTLTKASNSKLSFTWNCYCYCYWNGWNVPCNVHIQQTKWFVVHCILIKQNGDSIKLILSHVCNNVEKTNQPNFQVLTRPKSGSFEYLTKISFKFTRQKKTTVNESNKNANAIYISFNILSSFYFYFSFNFHSLVLFHLCLNKSQRETACWEMRSNNVVGISNFCLDKMSGKT